jgi:eukaryotic-like serine/threonine-protein kinase
MLANDLSAGVADAIASLDGLVMADYELIERLGAGGYGEVWKAIGPGGLPKAVKVLYGQRDGEHAEAELRSLQKMRELRHPFLLSIERIEVVNSRLIVVMELADGNLSDRFDACRREGKPGVPRDELLGLLRDAADALDYMSEQHGLQHLDIKPDNLLLQGGHVKVGDLGLAKDISATNVSVLNGFTPMFAAPELFEGRPGRASDQYSLAIVYQMMLTGSSPFNGRTAAQLTAQHLRSQPDLTFLQPIDRPVIARALSKNMNSRFDNCTEFVAELIRRRHGRSTNVAFVKKLDGVLVSDTALLKTLSQNGAEPVHGKESTPVAISAAASANATLRPSVVIGVGGLAGVVLRRFKTRFCTNGVTTCPFPLLQIDTDRETLTSLKLSGEDAGLSVEETLSIPLRTSNEYRSASELELSWLSRRWLFNIPRSGKVEGIRPLGRLALCDHRKSVESRFQQVIKETLSVEFRETVSGLVELPLATEGVDVYVVAATTGGTSSGTLADIGLIVKNVLRASGIKGGEVHGILLHGTGTARDANDVHEANTVCVLRELRHLSTPGLGTDRGFEKAGVQADVAPFDHTSLVHLGDSLNADVFYRRACDVADHLFVGATTAAQLDFREWHRALTMKPTERRSCGYWAWILRRLRL